MTEPEDDPFAPALSASPATSPLRAGVALAAVLVVASASGCSHPGVGTDAGPPRDAGPLPDAWSPPDIGTDASIPGELPVPDAGLDAGDHPDSAAPDASATDV